MEVDIFGHSPMELNMVILVIGTIVSFSGKNLGTQFTTVECHS